MKGGMGSKTNPLKFMDQDYNILQDYCLKTNQRFVDEFFPPDPCSIGEGLLEPNDMARVEWIRPTVSRQPRVLHLHVFSDNIAQNVHFCWKLKESYFKVSWLWQAKGFNFF